MKTIDVESRGNTPLLIHKFAEQSEQAKATRRVMVDSTNPRDEATRNAYVAQDGTYYFNAFSIPATMANAGVNHKMRGSRKTLKFVVPSAVRMESDTVTILADDGKPAPNFEVDGRIMRYRPRFDKWGAKFRLILNDQMLSSEDAHRLLNEAGESIGIGDFRPEKRGPFGTFRVTKFEEIK
jgi:hypothetical protein